MQCFVSLFLVVNRLRGKTRLQNGLLCEEWDVIPYSLTETIPGQAMLKWCSQPSPIMPLRHICKAIPVLCPVVFTPSIYHRFLVWGTFYLLAYLGFRSNIFCRPFSGLVASVGRHWHNSACRITASDDCLEVKREYYQNCCVLDCVAQCSQSAAQLYEQFFQVQLVGFVTCLQLYYYNMVKCFWWDSSLISMTNWFPSVLWHCWFGHLACTNHPQNGL